MPKGMAQDDLHKVGGQYDEGPLAFNACSAKLGKYSFISLSRYSSLLSAPRFLFLVGSGKEMAIHIAFCSFALLDHLGFDFQPHRHCECVYRQLAFGSLSVLSICGY